MLTNAPQEAPISLCRHFLFLARTLILVDASNGYGWGKLLLFWQAIYDIWLKGDSSLLEPRIWKCPVSDPKQWKLIWCNLRVSHEHFSTSGKYLSKRMMLFDMTRKDGLMIPMCLCKRCSYRYPGTQFLLKSHY